MLSIYVSTGASGTEEEQLDRLFPARRRQALARRGQERARCIASGLLLMKALGREGIVCTDETFAVGAHGKPYLKEGGLFFNLSHAGSVVVCAVSSVPVGVDTERLERFLDEHKNERLAARILNETEYAAWDEKRTPSALLALWVKKESLLKLGGEGFSRDVHSADTFSAYYEMREFPGYAVCACTEEPQRAQWFFEEV